MNHRKRNLQHCDGDGTSELLDLPISPTANVKFPPSASLSITPPRSRSESPGGLSIVTSVIDLSKLDQPIRSPPAPKHPPSLHTSQPSCKATHNLLHLQMFTLPNQLMMPVMPYHCPGTKYHRHHRLNSWMSIQHWLQDLQERAMVIRYLRCLFNWSPCPLTEMPVRQEIACWRLLWWRSLLLSTTKLVHPQHLNQFPSTHYHTCLVRIPDSVIMPPTSCSHHNQDKEPTYGIACENHASTPSCPKAHPTRTSFCSASNIVNPIHSSFSIWRVAPLPPPVTLQSNLGTNPLTVCNRSTSSVERRKHWYHLQHRRDMEYYSTKMMNVHHPPGHRHHWMDGVVLIVQGIQVALGWAGWWWSLFGCARGFWKGHYDKSGKIFHSHEML